MTTATNSIERFTGCPPTFLSHRAIRLMRAFRGGQNPASGRLSPKRSGWEAVPHVRKNGSGRGAASLALRVGSEVCVKLTKKAGVPHVAAELPLLRSRRL